MIYEGIDSAKYVIIQLFYSSTNIYFTAEEKIRNYKMPSNDQEGADSIPSFLLKTYEILEVRHQFSTEFQIQ